MASTRSTYQALSSTIAISLSVNPYNSYTNESILDSIVAVSAVGLDALAARIRIIKLIIGFCNFLDTTRTGISNLL